MKDRNEALIKSLRQVAHRWLDKKDCLRQEAIAMAAQEFCLSPASFEWALEWIFSLWTETRIREIVENNPFKQSKYAAQVLAGNTPAMLAQGFLQGAILNIPQCIKIPKAQSRFARLLHRSFEESAAYLSALWEVDTWQNRLPQFYTKLSQADVVFAYGRDETMATLKSHLSAHAIYRAHGQVESAAIIFKEAADRQALERLAYDMLSYDQRGCLSPRLTFIERGGVLSPEDCATIFAEEILPPVAAQFPRGGLFPGEAERILHQGIVCGFRGSLYRGKDWTVSYAEHAPWPEETLPRFMLFKPFVARKGIITELTPFKERLICLGLAGREETLSWLAESLKVPVCQLGKMQKQVLVW